MLKIKIIYLLILLNAVYLFSLNVQGASSTILDAGSSACGRSSTSSTSLDICNTSLYYDIKGGYDRSHADIVYIPYKQNDADINYNFDGKLFLFEDVVSVTLNLKLTGTNDNASYYFIAVRDSDNTYKVSNANARYVQQNQTITFTLSQLKLTEITDTSSQINYGGTSASTIIYIFKAPLGFTAPEIDITDQNYANGYYVKLNFSTLHDTVDTNAPVLEAASRGDKQLKLKYNKGTVGSAIYSTDNSNFLYSLAYYFSDLSSVPGDYQSYKTITDAGGKYQTQETENFGGATLKGLTNGVTYHVAIALMNKYKFISLSSAFVDGTPQEIEAFLEGKSCYLISAGFQTDHMVLEYFRMIRDHYLLKFSLGEAFVSWYYDWSPPVALFIIKHPMVAASIRGMAWTLYALMNYFPLFLLLFLGLAVTFFYLLKLKKAKI